MNINVDKPEDIMEDEGTVSMPVKEFEKLISRITDLEHKYYIENKKVNEALKCVKSYDLGKYDYSIPPYGIIELKDILGDGKE